MSAQNADILQPRSCPAALPDRMEGRSAADNPRPPALAGRSLDVVAQRRHDGRECDLGVRPTSATRARLLLRRTLLGLLWLNLHRIGFPTWLRAARLPDAGATAAFTPAASSASASFAA